MSSRLPSVVAFGISLLAPSAWGQSGEIVITELLTENHTIIADEDGDYPDWIELYNSGDEAIDLTGWCLTDDFDLRTKWRFPEVTIPRHGFLLVFASGKDRARPGRELHTNFRIGSSGESAYLFLPDGLTTASALAAGFRPQIQDVSYGVPMDSRSDILVPEKATARALVPADGALGTAWRQVEFDDAAWTEGPTGVGYDRGSTYDSLIGLDVEAGMRLVSGSIYIRIRFEVPDPSVVDALFLSMVYDDGFVAYVNGQEVASRNAPAAPSWDSVATAKRVSSAALAPEEIALTDVRALLRPGTNVLAIHGLAGSARETSFVIAPELRSVTVAGIEVDRTAYFSSPSPGKPNGAGERGIAESPRLVVAGSQPEVAVPNGGFSQSFQLELRVDSPTAVVRYTTDRTVPRETSTPYTAPIAIERSTVVIARTFEDGLAPSPLETRTYIKLAADAAAFSSNLPLVLVNTFGKAFIDSQTNRLLTPVNIAVFDTEGDGRARLTGAPGYIGPAGMRYRGESSYGWPKRQYALELRDEAGYDRDAPLLGMPADSDWVLNGPYSDKSLMRNFLAYSWSNAIGRYAPHPRLVEVFVNTTTADVRYAHYVGVYILVEKIKQGPGRVDVSTIYPSETEEPGLTGGYIFKKDKTDPATPGFATAHNPSLWYVYPQGAQSAVAAGEPAPRARVMTMAQKTYLGDFLRDFENALYGVSFQDPVAGYAPYIDIDSFIDHHIIVELTKNIDGFRLSTYMHKDREGKLNMGPVWDYNLSLGNANYLNGWLAEGWYWSQLGDGDYPWWRRLFQDPAFDARYRARWFELREGPLSLESLLGSIDGASALLTEAAERNFQKWRILGRYDWPNWHIPSTWQDEVQWMRQWLIDRVQWMDGTLLPTPEFSRDGGDVELGFALEITSVTGKPYYTLNGPDPKAASGAPAPEAVEYTAPIVLTANTRVRARTLAGGAWSAMREATFVVDPLPLRITEVMYNPLPPEPPSAYIATDFEFIELVNVGSEAIELGDTSFSRGVTFSFATSEVRRILPGECVVVVENPEAFASRYDTSKIRVAGQYANNLSDSGELLEIKGPLGETVQSFRYDDIWHPTTDGGGYSLEIVDSSAAAATWGDASSWRASDSVGGTPGRHDDGQSSGRQRPGDASQDGRYNVTDAARLLMILFDGMAPPCAGDVSSGGNLQLLSLNGDAQVDVSDAVYFLSYLFLNGPAPAQGTACVPMPGCSEACAP